MVQPNNTKPAVLGNITENVLTYAAAVRLNTCTFIVYRLR